MQSSLPAEPTRRNVKAADIVVSAEVAKIVELGFRLQPDQITGSERSKVWLSDVEPPGGGASVI
jgi:hypothetical protein